MSLVVKSVSLCASKIYNTTKAVKTSIFAFVAVGAIVASLGFTGTRIAYKVNYSGNIIATVGSKQLFFEALQMVIDRVDGEDVESVVAEPQFATTIALNNSLNSKNEVADAIIDNTDEIVRAATLLVNSSVAVRAEAQVIEAALDNRLESFNVEGAECSNRFYDDVKVENGYYMLSELDSADTAQSVISSLSVITEMRKTSDISVPYKSTVQKTNEQVIGYNKVSVTGVAGVNRVTEDIVMLNGEVQSTATVDTVVVVEPVNEVILKGTAKSKASAAQKQAAHSAGFIFPLPSGSWKVSSYYGDGRNHKGVDICAKSGTEIYAVADGKVVLSRWNGDYGYCVIVEHTDGTRTLYAHARQLCCNVGDTVSAGEVIALVGTTGQSTGNHLHFEVVAGGRNVDPAPYINLD